MAAVIYCDDDQAFALQLQLSLLTEDVPGVAANSSNAAGFLSDWELARSLYAAELQTQKQIQDDQRLAASIRRAVALDGEIINQEIHLNQQFQRDREIAQKLSAGEPVPASTLSPPSPPPPPPPAPPKQPSGIFNTNNPFLRPKLSYLQSRSSSVGRGNSRRVGHKDAGGERILCDICTEHVEDYRVVSLSCEHTYCLKCLYKLFKHAIDDPSTFPPKCCEKIPSTLAAEVLNDSELEKYFRESLIYDAGGRRPTCANRRCHQVLYPGWIKDNVGLCLRCNGRTCLFCMNEAHLGDCPQDESSYELYRLAAEKRWQRCYNCYELVELTSGCYHMVCRCKAEFCYRCGVKWKTCTCPKADENAVRGNFTAAILQPSSSSSLARPLPAQRRAALEEDHRKQALLYEKGVNERISELQTLRRTRECQRDAMMVDRMVREEEIKARQEMLEEQKKKEKEKRALKKREQALQLLFRKKLTKMCELKRSKGKGKGRSVNDRGELEPVVALLVERTMEAESRPSTPARRPWGSSSSSQPPRKKREMSPNTRARMGGLHGVLTIVGASMATHTNKL
ncbi:hypothetical protein BDZ91DRAFT_732697 [Kalaharituber pfeilii]|nr:hypothetical protein BDZ91DRAFT_732697 [Kalaharituber pfeilii]